MSVISGTRRAFKELVDGTIRVQIDIDPRFKKDFFELFPNVDMPCAIAPLVNDFERREPEPAKGGPLARLAGIWCKDEEFQEWIGVNDEEEAAEIIRETCQVQSRAELDNGSGPRYIFEETFRKPYMDWLKEKDK